MKSTDKLRYFGSSYCDVYGTSSVARATLHSSRMDDISLSNSFNVCARVLAGVVCVRPDSNALLMPRDEPLVHDYLIEMELSALLPLLLLLLLQGSCIIYSFCFHYGSNLRFTNSAPLSASTMILLFSINVRKWIQPNPHEYETEAK